MAQKYGYSDEQGTAARGRVIEILTLFANRLAAQKAKGSEYLFDCGMTAVDIYVATIVALIQALPDDVCAMRADTRRAFSDLDDETREAAEPLFLHRDLMYERWLVPVLRL